MTWSDIKGHDEIVDRFRRALARVEVVYVDLDKFPRLGGAYEVTTVPAVFFVDRTGDIVDRLDRLEEPVPFLARVTKLLGE